MKDIKNPIPQGKYIPAKKSGNFIYTAGMTPRDNGILILEGQVKIKDDISTYKKAVRQATQNALVAAKNILTDNESINSVVYLTVYINAENGYKDHSKIADFATDFLYEELGEKGIGSRAAVGVMSLPGNAPVEVQLVLDIVC